MIAVSILGLILLVGISYFFSENRQQVSFRQIISALLIQLAVGLFMLKTKIGYELFTGFKDLILILTDFSKKGAGFVFGQQVVENYSTVFIISIVPIIIFISSLSAILYHLRILQLIIRALAFIFQKFTRITGLESLIVSANIFLGQTEAPLLVKPYLNQLSRSELMVMMTSGMATVAGSVLAIYVSIGAEAGHILSASIMSAPASILFAKLFVPLENKIPKDETTYELKSTHASIMDALCSGATDGLKLSLNVIAMLIATISIIFLVDYLMLTISGDRLSLMDLLGYGFYPLALFLGISPDDAYHAGIVLGNKLVFNEILAYEQLFSLDMSEHTRVILTYAVCGFANISSIAILIGGIGSLAKERRSTLISLSFKALIAATFASYSTAILAGLILSI
jgi:CNT family concentrative nucleoside transporter